MPLLALTSLLLLAAGQPERPWLQVDAPHVQVVSDADAATARRVAWQFEQFRALLVSLCPWASVDLDRPFTVIAPADGDGMRTLLVPPRKRPRLTQRLRAPQAAPPPPDAVFRSGQDRYLAAAQGDLARPDPDRPGPYRPAFLGLADVMLGPALPRLPGWLAVGLREYAATAVFREQGSAIGLPPHAHLAALHGRLPLPLVELLAQDRSSPYLQRGERRQLFDAECWALLHHLLAEERPRLQELLSAMRRGDEPAAATQAALGDIDELEHRLAARVKAGTFAQAPLPLPLDDPGNYPVHPLSEAEAGAARASLEVAVRRLPQARELVDRALASNPELAAAHEVRGLVLESSGDGAAAQQAYGRAVELGVDSYLSYLKVAAARSTSPVFEVQSSAEEALAKAVELAPRFAPAFSFQGEFLVRRGKPLAGLESARRGVSLAPLSAPAHLSLGRVLGDLRRLPEARAEAQLALDLARTDAERLPAQDLLAALERLAPQ
jgi:tetratricopeptide (TPR) repeat protein